MAWTLFQGDMGIYAIVRTGGKQYRVEEGRSIKVERLPAAEGSTIELTEVLALHDGKAVTVGTPVVTGARVVAEVMSHGRGAKVVVFKYKPKVRYRRRTGHRQAFTELRIDEILGPGQKPTPRKRQRRKREEEEAPAEAEVAAPEAVAEAPAVAEEPAAAAAPETEAAAPETAPEEAPKPRRRSRKKTEEE